jgi:nitrous-oxide reductase
MRHKEFRQRRRGTLSFITAHQPGKMDIEFQILMPGFNYELGHAGKGPGGAVRKQPQR